MPDKPNLTNMWEGEKKNPSEVITRFRYIENSGREREYFWYRAKGYMVVVEYINPNFALITGFCVDHPIAHTICASFKKRKTAFAVMRSTKSFVLRSMTVQI